MLKTCSAWLTQEGRRIATSSPANHPDPPDLHRLSRPGHPGVAAKLVLNRNNNSYFQDYLVPLGHLPRRGFRASEHLLRKAFEWFDKRIGEISNRRPGPGPAPGPTGRDHERPLFFTVITVTDELNAYKVFETLNARGVRLSATDLLKNYLFSVLDRDGQHDHELRSLEGRWESMVGRLGAESFPDFLRMHWNSRRAFARQAELFKTIRGQVKTREAVFQLLRDMEEDLDTYLALILRRKSRTGRDELKAWPAPCASSMCASRFPAPGGQAPSRTTEFTGLVRACVVISLRYNVICGYSPAEQERTYNAVAERIARGEFLLRCRTGHHDRRLSQRCRLSAAFADKTIRTQSRNVARGPLHPLRPGDGCRNGLDFNSDGFTLEHILAPNTRTGWDAISDERWKRWLSGWQPDPGRGRTGTWATRPMRQSARL